MQGHRVLVVGVGEGWGRELPGLMDTGSKGEKEEQGGRGGDGGEKMKIAWRYERLGEFRTGGGTAGSRGGSALVLDICCIDMRKNIPSDCRCILLDFS